MPNTSFNIIFAGDKVTIRPISDENYTAGWDHLGTSNLITDDHDFVMRRQDEKLKWLYDAIGFNLRGNISLPDLNSIDNGASANLLLVSDGSDIISAASQQNVVLGSFGVTVDGSSNMVVGSSGTEIEGFGNSVHSSPSTSIVGQRNWVHSSTESYTGVDDSLFFSAAGLTFAGSNGEIAVINSDGIAISNSGKSTILGSSSATIDSSNNCVVSHCLATTAISGSNSCGITSSLDVSISNSDRSHVLSTEGAIISNFDQVTILSSQNVTARKSNTVVLGYGVGIPSSSNITIELDAETGNAMYKGTVDVAGLTVNGIALPPNRLNNLNATVNPVATDDSTKGYSALSQWVNVSTNEIFTAISVAPGAANWQLATLTPDNLGNMAVINGTTVGQNLATLPNPGAVRFLRFNADNTVSALSAADYRTAIGLGSSAVLASDVLASNNTIVQRDASAGIAVNRITSASLTDIGTSISHLWGSWSDAPTSTGRISISAVINHFRAVYGMPTVDGAGNLFWNVTGIPVRKLQLPFSGGSTGAAFQNSNANSATTVNIAPNGTSNAAGVVAHSDSNLTNGHQVTVGVTATEAFVNSSLTGSGTQRPLSFQIAGTEHLRLATNGIVLASSDIERNAATGQASMWFSQAGTRNGRVFAGGGAGTDLLIEANRFLGLNGVQGAYLAFNGSQKITSDATGVSVSGRVGMTQGLTLGNSAQAGTTTLDWYEEGTFTPTLVGAVVAGTATYSVRLGSYQRVGNRCHFQLNIVWSSHTGTGNYSVTGLPFTASISAPNSCVAVSRRTLPITSGNTYNGYVSPGDAAVVFDQVTPAGVPAVVAISANGTLIITGSYEV